MLVDVNELKRVMAWMNQINQVPLSEITFMDRDKAIEISDKRIEDWKFVGLSNTTFVEMDAHLNLNEWRDFRQLGPQFL